MSFHLKNIQAADLGLRLANYVDLDCVQWLILKCCALLAVPMQTNFEGLKAIIQSRINPEPIRDDILAKMLKAYAAQALV